MRIALRRGRSDYIRVGCLNCDLQSINFFFAFVVVALRLWHMDRLPAGPFYSRPHVLSRWLHTTSPNHSDFERSVAYLPTHRRAGSLIQSWEHVHYYIYNMV